MKPHIQLIIDNPEPLGVRSRCNKQHLSEDIYAKIGNSRHDISLSELTDIQRQFGISVDDIMTSLREHGIITYRRYSGFQKKKNSMPDFRELVEKSRVELERSGRFVRMVYRALADEAITFSKAAVLLNTTIDSIKSNLQLV